MATAAELDTPAQALEAFRADVRDWLAANFPASLKGKDNLMSAVEGPTEESADERAWRQAMGDKGWGV
ncbi:acyl-CoA dehydrogenase, partial [Acinetobacter baumannii]